MCAIFAMTIPIMTCEQLNWKLGTKKLDELPIEKSPASSARPNTRACVLLKAVTVFIPIVLYKA